MRPLQVTAEDVLSFARSALKRPPGKRPEILAVENGETVFLDFRFVPEDRAVPGTTVEVQGAREAQPTLDLILLTRAELAQGRYAHLLEDDGSLGEQAAAQIADTVNIERGFALPAAVYDAHLMGELAELDARRSRDSAQRRAEAVAFVVKLCDGNQSRAARLLGLSQPTVHNLAAKAAAAG